MTIKQIAIKIFKSNLKRYLFYFLCNSFAVMVFFMFSTLLFNESLHRSKEIEEGISEAVMIPTVALLIFSIFFISYAHSAFIKGRKKEFGLFMTLGMSTKDIRKIILVENSIIAGASICLGIIAGSLFSRFFFLIIMSLIGVKSVSFELNLNSYLYSIGLFSLIFAIAVGGTMVVTSKFEIVKLLKEERTSKKNKHANPVMAAIAFIALLSTLYILFANFGTVPENDGQLLLFCTISIMITLYIMISQLGSFCLNIIKRRPSGYYRHLLLLTNLDYKFKQVKKIIYLITVMVIVTIFYIGFVLNIFLGAEKAATDLHPYDIAFVQTEIPFEKLSAMMDTKGNPITEHKTLEVSNYFDSANYNYRTVFVADDQLSAIANKPIQVDKGSYLILVQLNLQGKAERKRMVADIQQDLPNIGIHKLQSAMFGRLINSLNYIDNSLIVLNSADYQQLKNNSSEVQTAEIQLLNVKDWKNSKEAVMKLQEKLTAANKVTPEFANLIQRRLMTEQEFFQPGSKIGLYDYNKQGGGLVLYLVTFISILFFIATVIILLLRLFSELEDEKKNYKKLYKIGITEKEIRKIIAGELKILFFAAPLIGIGISLVYTSTFFKESGMNVEIYRSSLSISSVYLLFQLIYYFIVKRKYANQIIGD
ncbi:ABC transporter permease [Neobacillus novalis]|uniref:ABC transporter permease n=1 Tax=Neobacillus novalis TaxID=220687 RepID=A0AA95MQY7_9BACI|nr:ABC transporter permease [Neobacillus novalis]WHY85611.1 ABC transporter permease [Neobacillus novalis]